MTVTLLVVGKTEIKWLKEAILEYEQRLKHYIDFKIEVIASVKNSKSLPVSELKDREGELILKKAAMFNRVVLLDERGNEYSSKEFADCIEKFMNSSVGSLCFVVGGAYGFSDAVYKAFANTISFSRMTFSHQMIRLLVVEQLYRAFTILNHHPYHNQ